ncbi:MAG: hypothetical protein ACRD3Q_19235 [Terriglobales bacterium]
MLTLSGGLIGHLIHEVKVENLIKVGMPNIDLRIETALKRLGPVGPEYVRPITDFDLGRAAVKPSMFGDIQAVCSVWTERTMNGHEGLLLIVGATDRVPLSSTSRSQYESNFGLARARSEAIKAKIADCGVPVPQMLALVSGPKNTPENAYGNVRSSGFAEDRRVDVWAIWGIPGGNRQVVGFRTSASGEGKSN